jgi:hypothetical protein
MNRANKRGPEKFPARFRTVSLWRSTLSLLHLFVVPLLQTLFESRNAHGVRRLKGLATRPKIALVQHKADDQYGDYDDGYRN